VKTIAFFNNKGGVGKTTLVYHLAHMLSRLGYRALAVDLDPQANLTSAFFGEERLEQLWDGGTETIMACVEPILEGTGDIRPAVPQRVTSDLWVVAGDLGLSRFEDRLSEAWPKSYNNDQAALRTTSAFFRIIAQAGAAARATVALVDVGPNLGAINRAALLAADFLVIPLAADLYSLQGLKNLGPTVRTWRQQWHRVRDLVSTTIALPEAGIEPAGYVVLQHAVRLDRPVRAYARWLARIPAVYREMVLGLPDDGLSDRDEHCLASLRNFRSLMPMAQDARKPMFDLRPADGAIGSHAQLAQVCAQEFADLARRLAKRCDLGAPSADQPGDSRQARLG
jgi:chromosome partitioning protein